MADIPWTWNGDSSRSDDEGGRLPRTEGRAVVLGKQLREAMAPSIINGSPIRGTQGLWLRGIKFASKASALRGGIQK